MFNRYALSLFTLVLMIGLGYYLGFHDKKLGFSGTSLSKIENAKITNTQPSTQNNPKIGIVNQSRLRDEAEIFKKLMDEQNRLFQEAHQQFAAKEADLRKAFEELKQQNEAEKNSPRFLQQKEEFDRTVAKFQKEMLEKKEDLQKYFDQIRANINKIVVEVVESFAKENQLDMIIDSTLAIYHKGKDLTDDIVKKLNQRSKEIQWREKDIANQVESHKDKPHE